MNYLWLWERCWDGPRCGTVQRTGAEVQHKRPAIPSASEECGKGSFEQVTDRYVAGEEEESMDKSGSGKRGKTEENDGEFEGSAGFIGPDDHNLVAGLVGLCLKG